MIQFALPLTIYIFLSFILFLVVSNTIAGWILYIFLLLPFYGIVLLAWWMIGWLNRRKRYQLRHFKYWILGIVLCLQLTTLLVSPANCYGYKGGSRCYSNLQVVLTDVPRSGSSNATHWQEVEDSFFGSLSAYIVALATGLLIIGKFSEID
jgi:hypothetical protein